MSFKDRIKQFALFFKNRNKLFIIIFVPLLLLPLPILVKSQVTCFIYSMFSYILKLILWFCSFVTFAIKASNCAFVMMLMSIFWITEALPIPVTSLLPVVLLPMLGVLPSDKVAMGYFKVAIIDF
jgi:di/tricarboxylate transporter